jgi:hypothetical protein
MRPIAGNTAQNLSRIPMGAGCPVISPHPSPQHESRLSRIEYLRGEISMTPAILSPLVSEFKTEEQETSYTAWLKAKVQASLDDPRPSIPHDKVMAEARALLAAKKEARAAD